MPRDDSLLLDVLLAARRVARYTDGVAPEAFETVLQDAVMRQIQIIGEAASRISLDTREANPEVPWHEMIGMRNRLVYGYSKIDLKRVWKAACESAPLLISAIAPLVPPDQE